MSDTHVQADYLAGRLAFNLWTWTGEANKPSSLGLEEPVVELWTSLL